MADATAIQSAGRADSSCQLQHYLATSGGEVSLRGKTYRIENLRNETGLGFFADFHGPRSKYLAMQVRTRVIGRPGAEAWDVLRMSGRGSVVVSFAVFEGKILTLG